MNVDKMNETELKDYLKKFANAVITYDKLRDDELNFLDEHPERGMWDEEMEDDYNQLLDEISENWEKVSSFLKEIDKIK